MDRIDPIALPPSLVWAIGMPRPREAILSHDGVGGVREARFERGLAFHEPIDVWDPPRRLSFAIHVDETTLSPVALDEHVRVGSTHFDVERGTFFLEPTAGGVRLRLESTHRVSSHFNWYAKIWTRWIMSELQRSICHVIQARAEAVEATAQHVP